MGNPLGTAPRMVFASSTGVLFTSAMNRPTYRTADNGLTWQPTIAEPVWRMDEDDLGNLYAGNYIKTKGCVAHLYKSIDGGASWTICFADPGNQHLHTVRWDNAAKRLYIAYGDHATRGQAYSDDRGHTWVTLASGPDEGDTDVCLTGDYIFWLSDDESGRVYRVNRATNQSEPFFKGTQFMWFGVSRDPLIYLGMMPSRRSAGERAALLASDDQGTTWQKVVVADVCQKAYANGLYAESRELSIGGWLYFSAGPHSYRIRHVD